MTTNVYDRVASKITSDTRWSADFIHEDGEHYLVYIDDVDFDKIAQNQHLAILMAGDSYLIDCWKKWLSDPAFDGTNRPYVKRNLKSGEQTAVHLCVICKDTKVILFACGTIYSLPQGSISDFDAIFLGSGGNYALSCWANNRCSITATESAKKDDIYSGGQVKFIDLLSGISNLAHNQRTCEQMTEQLKEKGMIMNKTTKKITTLKDFREGNFTGFDSVMDGSNPLSAPTPCDFKWDLESEAELDSALSDLTKKIKQQDNLLIT